MPDFRTKPWLPPHQEIQSGRHLRASPSTLVARAVYKWKETSRPVPQKSVRLPSNRLQVFVDHARFCSGQSCKQAFFAPRGAFLTHGDLALGLDRYRVLGRLTWPIQKANSKLACATNSPVAANDTRVSVKADALPNRRTSDFTWKSSLTAGRKKCVC